MGLGVGLGLPGPGHDLPRRGGRSAAAVDALLMDEPKNEYLRNGHNPQRGSRLPVYLPGNGGLLAAVSLMVGGLGRR